LLSNGSTCTATTWDEGRQSTVTMRKKGGEADYRYFPEPDLPNLVFDEDFMSECKASMPKLPVGLEQLLKSADP
jgi:Asp-tRNA(Asn)/Glu-tRNA(Gln) amidotransferase B subunit